MVASSDDGAARDIEEDGKEDRRKHRGIDKNRQTEKGIYPSKDSATFHVGE